MQLGQWRLDTLDGGRFRLDGGIMYGIIPKSLWHTVTPADANNQLPFAIHCVLARNGRQNVLIDTGYGGKLSRLDCAAHHCAGGDPLVDSLAALGLTPDDIDVVVLSHLHWDHAGGATRWDEQRQPVPTFPRATYIVSRPEWEDATSGAPELGGSYAPENFAPIERAGQLVLIDGEVEVVPGLWTRPTGGHTRGHQALVFESDGQIALYLGDLCPVTTHLRRMWLTAYDHFPLDVRRIKPELLGAAADHGWWVLWDHDPQFAVSRLERHRSREFVPTDARALL